MDFLRQALRKSHPAVLTESNICPSLIEVKLMSKLYQNPVLEDNRCYFLCVIKSTLNCRERNKMHFDYSKDVHNVADSCRKDLHSIVCYFMQQSGLGREDREDCTQECFLRLWTHLGSIGALAQAISEKRSWILRCIKRQVQNYCRSHRRRRECQVETTISLTWKFPGDSHEAIMIKQEMKERIEIYLNNLTQEQCNLLRRHYQDGETCVEIAASLGIATNAVEQRLLRSRRKLFKLFIENGFSESEVSDYFAVISPPLTIYVVH